MKERKKNTRNLTPIGDVIRNVLGSYRQESDEALVQIWSLWDTAVGKLIADNAQPEAFKGKLLLVNVTSSTWAHQLQFLKKDIIEKINQALGQVLVDDIRFKIGPV